MKTIYKLAIAELQTLFYSPVAWLILIIYTFQASMMFTESISDMVQSVSLGYPLRSVTGRAFGYMLWQMTEYLYLYIPLLTMGLMSRELGSGSIKLLYSSPVTNAQNILGKFLSMMIYALVLIGVLFLFFLYGVFTIKDMEIGTLLTQFLGIYLLICAYAAIGLFMSSITSYQVVAAMGTLAILAVLNMVGNLWQDIDFVRDITYWLSMRGRVGTFLRGMICSEDFLYFVIVIAMFLMLCILRLQARRQKISFCVRWGKYVGVVCIAMLLGYFSSRPVLMGYYDATSTKSNTLTPNSQDIVKRLNGGLTITTYVNLLDEDYRFGLPRMMNMNRGHFEDYVRFKPEIKIKYVYYYDKAENKHLDERYPNLSDKERAKKLCEIWDLDSNMFLPPEKIREMVDLQPEGNRFVRLIERESGEKTFLRVYDDMRKFPGESEITAALKRLVMELPTVGFLTGHGERDINKEGDRDYKRFAQDKKFRYALINQGFDAKEVTLDQDIPDDVRILVIAEMKQALTPEEKARLDAYVARGGDLLIISEPKRREFMNPIVEPFGVQILPGVLVKKSENFQPDLIMVTPTQAACELCYHFDGIRRWEGCVTMPSSSALAYTEDKGYTVTPLFMSDTVGSWNELQTTDFIDDIPTIDEKTGETEQAYPTALALSRKIGDKEQRIIILGDADCISNGEVSMSRKDVRAMNYSVIIGSFYWLSHEEVPIDIRRPSTTDTELYVSEAGAIATKIGFMGVLTAFLIFMALFIWIRRRGR